MQQAVHDRDDEYGPSQARSGEINTYPRVYEKGAACARSGVDIWGSAWAIVTRNNSVGKGLTDLTVLYLRITLAVMRCPLMPMPGHMRVQL